MGTTSKYYHKFFNITGQNVLMQAQEVNFMAPFGVLRINQPVCQVQNMTSVNVLLIPFEGNTNTRYTQGLKLYLWWKNNIEK